MKRGRGLRWLCHLTVLVWGAWLLAEAAPEAEQPAALATAVVRPVPDETPPAPEPEPATADPGPPVRSEPAPEPAPEEPGPRAVGAAELARGEALLDDAGSFPALSFSYDAFPSFGAYARAMTALGARFVVVERLEIKGIVDPESGAVRDFELAHDFSPRARDYTGEPGLASLARVARERYGDRAIIMMLVPRRLDAGLFGGLARLLAELGEGHGGLREIRGRYLRAASGGVRLQVEAAVRRDGTAVPVEAIFDLGQIAGKAAT